MAKHPSHLKETIRQTNRADIGTRCCRKNATPITSCAGRIVSVQGGVKVGGDVGIGVSNSHFDIFGLAVGMSEGRVSESVGKG